MKSKNWIRTVVLAGIIAWPGFETYRYLVAKQQLSTSSELKASVAEKLSAARVKYAKANIPQE